MEWVEAFALLLVSHLAGDYLLQTEFQALNKRGGLGRDPVRRRALLAHVGTLALAFVPVTAWLVAEAGAGLALATIALVLVTHLVQDDGRLLARYMAAVKHTDPAARPGLTAMVDQTFHIVVLLGAALLVAA